MSHFLNERLNVDDHSGFIFCAFRSFAMQMIGICRRIRIASDRNTQERHLGFLNESIQSPNTSTIASRHAINLIHDEASFIRDGDSIRTQNLSVTTKYVTSGHNSEKKVSDLAPCQPPV